MSGKENIIANILARAEAESAEIIKAAQDKADAVRKTDEEYCNAAKAETIAKAEKEAKTTMERYISVANMDVKKVILAAKQESIAKAMEAAQQKILNLSTEDYNKFLISCIERHGETGDCVVFAKADENRVEKAISYAKSKGLTTRLDGNFSGGLVLEGKSCDKNLTVAMLLKEYKEANESKIAEMLIGQ